MIVAAAAFGVLVSTPMFGATARAQGVAAPEGLRPTAPPRALWQYHHDRWSSDDGLPQRWQFGVVVTRDGYVWSGGMGGVTRFDGTRLVPYTSATVAALRPGDATDVLLEDRDGRLWVWLPGNRLMIGTPVPLGDGVAGPDRRFRALALGTELPASGILCVVQAPDGTLWGGRAAGGLARWTGARFEAVTDTLLPRDRSVRAIAVAPDGTLWVATDGASVLHYRPATTRAPAAVRAYGPREGLGSAVVWAVRVARDGTVWAGTDDGLAHLVPRTEPAAVTAGPLRAHEITMHRPASYAARRFAVLDVVEDADGALWLATEGGGLVRATRAPSTGDAPARHDARDTNAVRETRALATTSRGASWHFDAVTARDGLGSDIVQRLALDGRTLWLATRAGLERLQATPFVSFTQRDGLAATLPGPIHPEADGTVWVAPLTGGVVRYHPAHGRSDAPPPLARALTGDRVTALHLQATADGDTTLWLARFQTGLTRWTRGARRNAEDRGTVQTLTTVDGLPGNAVTAFLADTGSALWIGTHDGLGRLHWRDVRARDGRKRRTPIVRAVPLDTVRVPRDVQALTRSRDGSLWIGGAGRVARVTIRDGGARRPDGAIDTDGVAERDRDAPLVTEVRAAHRVDASGITWALHEDARGSLWIGGLGGLWRLREGRLHHFTDGEGMPAQGCGGIIDDGRGGFFLVLTGALAHVRRAALDSVADGTAERATVRLFGARDGLRNAEGVPGAQPAVMRGPDGRWWFATGDGIAALDAGALEPPRTAPRAVVEAIVVDGRTIAPSPVDPPTMRAPTRDTTAAAAPDTPRVVRIAPSPERLDVQLGAAARDGAPVRLRYRLLGYDDTWRDTGPRRSASWTRLPPGRYVLEAMAAYDDAPWQGPVASLSLVVPPRWWQHPRTRVAATLLALLGMAALVRLREGRLQARFALVTAERTRIAGELHDTLLQGVVGAALQFRAIASRLDPLSPTRGAIEGVLAQVNRVLADARNAVWDLRAPAGEGTSIEGALHAVVDEVVAAHAAGAATPVTTVAVTGPAGDLAPIVRTTVLRVAREALVNACRHARATRIELRLVIERDAVRLTVGDDGIGFAPDVAPVTGGSHWGVLGMRERAVRAGGHLAIESAPGAGARVVLVVPRVSVDAGDGGLPRSGDGVATTASVN